MDTQPKTYLGVSFGALIAFVWIILFLLIRHKSNKHHQQKERVI
jgi:branched-subunit amino acid ABC-type transport system permease component